MVRSPVRTTWHNVKNLNDSDVGRLEVRLLIAVYQNEINMPAFQEMYRAMALKDDSDIRAKVAGHQSKDVFGFFFRSTLPGLTVKMLDFLKHQLEDIVESKQEQQRMDAFELLLR